MNAQSIIPPNIDYGKISADKYSPDDTYEAGELRIQYNSLWKAKQAISVPEPWTPDHWDPTTLAAEFSALNSSMPQIHAGSYVPELVSGGDSLAVSSGNIQYFVVGNLCFLSGALWATINNPNADDIKLSLPPGIIPTSTRNYGWVGYHQSKAIDTMYVIMDNSGSGIAFEKPTATGSSGIKGTDMNNMTIQFSVVFAVNTSLDL